MPIALKLPYDRKALKNAATTITHPHPPSGGAGNVINNLKALGANVDIISVIGDCNISNELKGLINNINVETKYLFTQRGRISSKKSRVIAYKFKGKRFDCCSVDGFVEATNHFAKRFIKNI